VANEHDGERRDAPNPYESPREVSPIYSPADLAWWAWLKDRAMLWGCGVAVFASINAIMWSVIYLLWLLGYQIL
jgi:hypothetical protein